MERFIRFKPVKGKLEAEAMGFTGSGCKIALEQTVKDMGLKIEAGSEHHKPEFALEEAKTTQHVTH